MRKGDAGSIEVGGVKLNDKKERSPDESQEEISIKLFKKTFCDFILIFVRIPSNNFLRNKKEV